jgi:hypothetical protein
MKKIISGRVYDTNTAKEMAYSRRMILPTAPRPYTASRPANIFYTETVTPDPATQQVSGITRGVVARPLFP